MRINKMPVRPQAAPETETAKKTDGKRGKESERTERTEGSQKKAPVHRKFKKIFQKRCYNAVTNRRRLRLIL